jgi:ABC-type cobalamin/Fe3+-siderophores transport system ATPase subunit
MESGTFTLELPKSQSNGVISIETGQSFVIVGANGSGKTRLGTWIEFKSSQKDSVHRVSAQKSLSMPEHSTTSSLELAESDLFFGPSILGSQRGPSNKRRSRWGQKPNTFLLNDFKNLMVYLFTERFEKTNSHYEDSQLSEQKIAIPETKLGTVKNIWESIITHRELKIAAGEIKTHLKHSESKFYSASEMSDGERVIFYLIGQALCVPNNGILIIDEPELHLHKSIQTRLWREIQAARPDCLFVYMTHDVEFAASLTEAKKIWLKNFDGELWEWEEVPTIEGFPEELLVVV